MPDITIEILDTATAEAGPTQFSKDGFLGKDVPVRITASLSAGDTVVIEGGPTTTTADFEVLHTFTADEAVDVFVGRHWRARRTIDGAAGEATVTVQNHANQKLIAHV